MQRITETLNNFIEKLLRNPKEILEIFGALSKICPGRFKALSGAENTANIFQNNILLVTPLSIYFMKTMFTSLLAFLRHVYVKNTISLNIDTKKFSIFPSLASILSAHLQNASKDHLGFLDHLASVSKFRSHSSCFNYRNNQKLYSAYCGCFITSILCRYKFFKLMYNLLNMIFNAYNSCILQKENVIHKQKLKFEW